MIIFLWLFNVIWNGTFLYAMAMLGETGFVITFSVLFAISCFFFLKECIES